MRHLTLSERRDAIAKPWRKHHGQTKTRNQTIDIQVNGKPVAVTAGWTLSDFLASKKLHARLVVIERNGTILRHPQYPETVIEAGDVLEIVHFVGGGSWTRISQNRLDCERLQRADLVRS